MENESTNPAYLVIIPAYNEETTIKEVVLRAKKYADVCVINDCSNDHTPDILSGIENIHVIHHRTNTHIPGALLDGMRYAVDNNYDYAIAMDAGLSHNPNEIPLFMNHPHSDLAIGIRLKKTNTPLFRNVLSKGANIAYNCSLDFPAILVKRKYYHDLTSGYRRYSYKAMDIILSERTQSKSFDILLETVVFVYRNGLSISEVPITYDYSSSSLNLSVIKDCIKMCLKTIIIPKP